MGARSSYFRANVGAVLCNAEGEVLAFERSDVPGAWQLPQGGLEEDESPREAVLREVEEETGLAADALTFLGAHPDLLAYELPPDLRTEKTGRGQVQYWFYLAVAEAAAPLLPRDGEFSAWRWTSLGARAGEVVAFRRKVYRSLVDHVPRVDV